MLKAKDPREKQQNCRKEWRASKGIKILSEYGFF